MPKQCKRTKTGGRVANFDLADIVSVGKKIGMAELSVQRVAEELEVSPTAIYRHISSRRELDRLVGEAILADFELVNHPTDDLPTRLVQIGLQISDSALAHPGITQYMQTMFPRGRSGQRILEMVMHSLTQLGCDEMQAFTLGGSITAVALGLTSTMEIHQNDGTSDPDGFAAEMAAALDYLAGGNNLGSGVLKLPRLTPRQHLHFLIETMAHGLLQTLTSDQDIAALVHKYATPGAEAVIKSPELEGSS